MAVPTVTNEEMCWLMIGLGWGSVKSRTVAMAARWIKSLAKDGDDCEKEVLDELIFDLKDTTRCVSEMLEKEYPTQGWPVTEEMIDTVEEVLKRFLGECKLRRRRQRERGI